MEDSKIVELYWQRDEAAIHITEEKYNNYLMKIAFNVLSDVEDSKECVNDTYLKAWRSIPPNKPQYLSLYLGKITRSLAIDLLRKKNTAKRKADSLDISLSELGECISDGNAFDKKMDEKFLAEIIGKYLKTVSKDARKCFIRRYFYMDSISDICKFFHMSESKVKTSLHRTRKGLQKYLEKEGYHRG